MRARRSSVQARAGDSWPSPSTTMSPSRPASPAAHPAHLSLFQDLKRASSGRACGQRCTRARRSRPLPSNPCRRTRPERATGRPFSPPNHHLDLGSPPYPTCSPATPVQAHPDSPRSLLPHRVGVLTGPRSPRPGRCPSTQPTTTPPATSPSSRPTASSPASTASACATRPASSSTCSRTTSAVETREFRRRPAGRQGGRERDPHQHAAQLRAAPSPGRARRIRHALRSDVSRTTSHLSDQALGHPMLTCGQPGPSQGPSDGRQVLGTARGVPRRVEPGLLRCR